MYRAPVVIFLLAFSFLLISCGPRISPEEAKVLVALEEIRQGTEGKIAYDQFVQLLQTAETEINTLKKYNKNGSCFLGSVDKCYSAYEIARKAWKNKMDETDVTMKEDMDLTLSFSLSFAALSIEKANQCYK